MKKSFLFLVMASMCIASVYGQSKLSNKTAVFMEQQKQMSAEEMRHSPMSKMIKTNNGRQMVDCYVHFNGEIDENVLAMYGAELHVRFDELNIATAVVPVDALEALSENEKIAMVEMATPADFKLNWARQISFVDPVLNAQAPLSQSYLGRGIIVGVVDQELQYAHPAFWNQAHNRYRIKKVWNQQRSGNAPTGYSYGYEYVDSADILTAEYDIYEHKAESGHATHVMGIAAGADHSLDYYGVAQEADLIYVSCPGTSMTNIPEGIRYIFEKATEMNRPCVVNVSMGGNIGPHDGMSTESRLIEAMIGPGRLVCGSAGNEGDTKIHWGKSFTAQDTIGKTFYSSKSVEGYEYDYCPIDIWGDIDNPYQVRFVIYNKDDHANIYETQWINATPASRQNVNVNVKRTIESANDLFVTGSVSAEKVEANHRGNVYAVFQVRSLPSRTALGIEIKADSGDVHIFTAENYGSFTSSGQKNYGYTDGNTDMTVGEPTGVTRNIISVGAYTSYPKIYGTLGAKAGFSSMGPTLDGRIKPDISAPGQTLMSSLPDFGNLKNDRAASTTVGGKTYYYGYMQGTSMSSPYAAGVVAMWLEADPTLDYEDVIDIFHHTSCSDSFTGETPNNSWGYGKIDAYHGLIYILGLNVGVQNPEKPSVLAVYEEGNSDVFKIGFAKEMNDLVVRVADMSGRIVYASAEGDVMAGQEISIDLSGMTPGVYMINVGGENYKVVR